MADRPIALGRQLQVGRKVANIDAKYGPYESRQAAQEALGSDGMDVIAEGLTVGIKDEDGNIYEYWWQGGTTIDYLVRKINIGELGDVINKDRAYLPNDFSGLGKTYLKKNLKYTGFHFAGFVANLGSIEQVSLAGTPDEIVYETENRRFVGIKRGWTDIKYYNIWLGSNASVYVNPTEEYTYVCDADKRVYSWDGSTLVEKTSGGKTNLLTQEMLSKPNMIYVVQYDFDISGSVVIMSDDTSINEQGGYCAKKNVSIPTGRALRAMDGCYFRNSHSGVKLGVTVDNGTDVDLCLDCSSYEEASLEKSLSYYVIESITIPENSVLLFDGGSINNGEINLNGCRVLPAYDCILGSNLSVVGNPKAGTMTWDTENARPMWNNGEEWEPCMTDDTMDGELRLTQARINAIVLEDAVKVDLTASPNVVLPGAHTISLVATASTEVDAIKIKRNGTEKASGTGAGLTDGKTLTCSDTIEPSEAGDTTYTAEFVIGGLTKTDTKKVKTVYPIKYGAGATSSAAVNNAPARTTPAGTYEVSVSENGQYVFFVVPRNMDINKATMSGFTFPLEDPVNIDIELMEYKYYQSSNTYDAGTLTIVIS